MKAKGRNIIQPIKLIQEELQDWNDFINEYGVNSNHGFIVGNIF
jgi:hypothetical protein